MKNYYMLFFRVNRSAGSSPWVFLSTCSGIEPLRISGMGLLTDRMSFLQCKRHEKLILTSGLNLPSSITGL